MNNLIYVASAYAGDVEDDIGEFLKEVHRVGLR